MEKRKSRCSVELRVLCFLNVVLLSCVVFLGYYSYSLEHRVRKLENQSSLVNLRVKRELDNVSSEELDYICIHIEAQRNKLIHDPYFYI